MKAIKHDAGPTLSTGETLRKLAGALGCEVSAFAGPVSGELCQTVELLRLWNGIDDARDRVRVLAFIESLATPGSLLGAAGLG